MKEILSFSEQSKSRSDIITRIQNLDIKPDPVSFQDIIKHLKETKYGQQYDTNKGAELYDKVARYSFAREKVAQDITIAFWKNILIHPNDALICDRAAGTGIITEMLVSAGYNVRASDVSQEQLDLLSKRLPNVETVIEDFNQPMQGVKDGSVDGIIEVAADRYMTVDGQKKYVQESQRVLKKNGVLIWPLFLGECTHKLKYGLKWKAGKKEISQLLEDNGFRIASDKKYFYKINSQQIFGVC